MGIRMPGIGSGIDPQLIDKLVEVQRIPLETAEKRKELIVAERDEYQKFFDVLGEFEQSLTNLKSRNDFYKLKLESSHPEIIDGVVDTSALPGTYSFEVKGLAKAGRELSHGFPDRDQTPVGFGYMTIEKDDGSEVEVVVDPGSTLEAVALKINDMNAGLKAMVINTNYQPDPYRLLVISEKTGVESKLKIDGDTTFLQFGGESSARNLEVMFEDIPVTNTENKLDELISGVTFNIKSESPGTLVKVNINPDIDVTFESIKEFVTKYNELANFVHTQYQIDPRTQRAGLLSGDSSLKTVMRGLQSSFSNPINNNSKFKTLAALGITTDPKSGALNMDDAKVRQHLAEDYDGVAGLFIRSENSKGIADQLADKVKGYRDPAGGMVRSKLKSIDTMIKNADRDLEQKERQIEQREQAIRQRFNALESRISDLNSQGNFLAQRFGGGGGQQG